MLLNSPPAIEDHLAYGWRRVCRPKKNWTIIATHSAIGDDSCKGALAPLIGTNDSNQQHFWERISL